MNIRAVFMAPAAGAASEKSFTVSTAGSATTMSNHLPHNLSMA
jgi:hypothetical protein